MNTRTLTIVLVVVVLLALGGWFVYSGGGGFLPGGSATSTAQMATSTTATSTAQSSSGATQQTGTKMTLNQVVAQGGNYTCTIDEIDATQRTTGTIYGANGKTRLDLTVALNSGTNVTTHIVRSGGYSYTWVEGQQTGVKTAITASSPIVAQPSGGVISYSPDTNFSSECRPWVPDTSKFQVPSAISFIAR